MSELLIVIEGDVVGRVRAAKSGQLSLDYEDSWLESPRSYPLSVNLPLARISYSQRVVAPYLWNLLPENPNVLQRWGQQYHVSGANPFKLLTHVGADVHGAAQFIPPQRWEEIQSARRPTIDWISQRELEQRLQQLRADIAAVRRPGDAGKMSLPGAQAKTAYYWDPKANRWGVPSGRTPTTHIIKPCVPGFDGLVENEHFCQDLAARLGLQAARSFVMSLDETYIVVERYDRLPPPSGAQLVERVHQEDVCQALGLMPGKKYQEDGGPGIAKTVQLIRRVSSQPVTDVDRFLRANIFNWLIGGTDAHAKNYSLLIAEGSEVRLAPLYDISSQLPYPELIRLHLAMKVGEHYDIRLIGAADWRAVAQACELDEADVLKTAVQMAESLPGEVSATRDQAFKEGLSKQIISPLARQLIEHASERLAALTSHYSSKKRRARRIAAK